MGLTKIEMGEVAANGAMQTTLAQIGYTYKDSCELSTAEPEITELFVEEVDLPLDTEGDLGAMTLTWDILNPNVDEFASMMGGTATVASTSGQKDKWQAPTTWSSIEKAFKLTPSKGFVLSIPRGQINASITGGWKKGNPLLLHMEVKVLTPVNSSGVAQTPYILEALDAYPSQG